MKSLPTGHVLVSVLCFAGLCQAAIVVESPNGGEAIAAKSQWLITWRCDAWVRQVAVEFSFTGGASWQTIAPAAASNQRKGSFLWTVPSLSSPKCLIRVTSADNPADSDQSNAIFTVFPCALRMDYDGDCVVTFADFAGLAQEWLLCGDPYDAGCTGNRPPRITSTPPLQTAIGQAYTYDIKATDPDNDTLAYDLLLAPAGMVIDSASGKVLWNPSADQKGKRTVVIQVRDELGAADVQVFDLNPAVMYTGAPVQGMPSLLERRVIVYTNALRMAPQQYRDRYMAGFQPSPSGILKSYSEVEPLYYERQLNESARFHAQDMAGNGCFQHDSCDGTPWAQRLRSFYPEASMVGENVAAGYPKAQDMVNGLVCDESGGQCAADRSSQAGHRSNMMEARLTQIGTGYVYDAGSEWRHYWVQDFVSNTPADKAPIVAACHDLITSGKTSFLLNYRDESNQPPASIQVVVNDVAYTMNLDIGSAAAGTYRLDLSAAQTCRRYYFVAVTASGEAWRYPGPGVFLTSGEGNCTGDYQQ